MTTPTGMEEYKVDKNLCIDCNACYTTYPEMFKQVAWKGETKAEEYAPVTVGKYNPWDVVGCCPTDAISKLGEMPLKPESAAGEAAVVPLEDLGPWEDRWARVKKEDDSKWEVMKRYGMAAVVGEEKDRYVVKVEFPEKTPHHILKFQMGLPDAMPDYKQEVSVSSGGTELVVFAKLDDPHIQKLCGKINSFPDRFLRKFNFPIKVEIARKSYRGKILTVELKKVPAATLH